MKKFKKFIITFLTIQILTMSSKAVLADPKDYVLNICYCDKNKKNNNIFKDFIRKDKNHERNIKLNLKNPGEQEKKVLIRNLVIGYIKSHLRIFMEKSNNKKINEKEIFLNSLESALRFYGFEDTIIFIDSDKKYLEKIKKTFKDEKFKKYLKSKINKKDFSTYLNVLIKDIEKQLKDVNLNLKKIKKTSDLDYIVNNIKKTIKDYKKLLDEYTKKKDKKQIKLMKGFIKNQKDILKKNPKILAKDGKNDKNAVLKQDKEYKESLEKVLKQMKEIKFSEFENIYNLFKLYKILIYNKGGKEKQQEILG